MIFSVVAPNLTRLQIRVIVGQMFQRSKDSSPMTGVANKTEYGQGNNNPTSNRSFLNKEIGFWSGAFNPDLAAAVTPVALNVLPVCKGDRLVGMLTDRDLTIRAVAEGRDPKITTVEEVMTPEVAYCFEDQDIEEAERVMEKHQIRRLPV